MTPEFCSPAGLLGEQTVASWTGSRKCARSGAHAELPYLLRAVFLDTCCAAPSSPHDAYHTSLPPELGKIVEAWPPLSVPKICGRVSPIQATYPVTATAEDFTFKE